jgi:hypothetical protein
VKGKFRLGLVDSIEHQVSALMPSEIEFPVVAANGDMVQMFDSSNLCGLGMMALQGDLLKKYDAKHPGF